LMDVIDAISVLLRAEGLVIADPVELRSTNNVVVWLAPSPVVAKVSMEHERAVRELWVAAKLAALEAPVVPPIDVGLEQPVRVGDATVTLWRYEPQDEAPPLDASHVAQSLFLLHERLEMLEDRALLPSFAVPLEEAVRSLERSGFAPRLAPNDRRLLREALVAGLSEVQRTTSAEQVLHGSPHRHNLLAVDGVPTFIDFETVERGPREWDLAHLEQEVAVRYPGEVDADMLDRCRTLVSAATSAWCWDAVDRGPDMRRHAEEHLQRVRSGSR
jgi:hypothetical protein